MKTINLTKEIETIGINEYGEFLKFTISGNKLTSFNCEIQYNNIIYYLGVDEADAIDTMVSRKGDDRRQGLKKEMDDLKNNIKSLEDDIEHCNKRFKNEEKYLKVLEELKIKYGCRIAIEWQS